MVFPDPDPEAHAIYAVTGGTGFIGSRLVESLLERGSTVRILSRSTPKQDRREGAEYVIGDVRDPAAVEELVAGAEVVFHLAARFRSPAPTAATAFRTNVVGTTNVLQASHRQNVKRLVHCSTVSVHGSLSSFPAGEDAPFNTQAVPYAATKALAEIEIGRFAEETGLPVVIVRPTSVYGPGDFRLLKLFRMIDRGRFVMVGRGQARIDVVHVDDVVAGLVLASTKQACPGEAFILGGQNLPVRDFVRRIAEALGVKQPSFRIPAFPVQAAALMMEKASQLLAFDPPFTRQNVGFFLNEREYSIEKARERLGYEPSVNLTEGLRQTVLWYREAGYL